MISTTFSGLFNFQERKLLKEMREVVVTMGVELYRGAPRASQPLEGLIHYINVVNAFLPEVEGLLKQFQSLPEGRKKKVALTMKKLEELVGIMHLVAPCPWGVNRTPHGEPATPGTIFLGDTHGLCTFTVKEWAARDPSDIWRPDLDPDLTVREIIDSQANGLMKKREISKILSDLLKK